MIFAAFKLVSLGSCLQMLSSLLFFYFITHNCWLYQATGCTQQRRGHLGAIMSAALVAAACHPSIRTSTGALTRSVDIPHISSWKPTISNSLWGRTILIGPCSLWRGSGLTMTSGPISSRSLLVHSFPVQLRTPGLVCGPPHEWGH